MSEGDTVSFRGFAQLQRIHVDCIIHHNMLQIKLQGLGAGNFCPCAHLWLLLLERKFFPLP